MQRLHSRLPRLRSLFYGVLNSDIHQTVSDKGDSRLMVIVYCYVTSPSRSSFLSSGTQAAVAKLPSSSEKRGMGSSSFPHFLLLGAGAEESLFCATHIANYFGTEVNKGGAIIFSVEADRTMGNVLFGILGGLPLLTLVWLASKLLRGLQGVFCWGTNHHPTRWEELCCFGHKTTRQRRSWFPSKPWVTSFLVWASKPEPRI